MDGWWCKLRFTDQPASSTPAPLQHNFHLAQHAFSSSRLSFGHLDWDWDWDWDVDLDWGFGVGVGFVFGFRIGAALSCSLVN